MEIQKIISSTDHELIEAYLATRDTTNFRELYKRYSGKIFSKCLSILEDEESAHQATQDIFLKIYLNITKFHFNSEFSTWVFKVAYNFCIELIRNNGKESELFSDSISNPDSLAENKDFDIEQLEVHQLKKVLVDIKAGDRAILLMRYQDNMSDKDIAQILTEEESVVKIKIERAKDSARLSYLKLDT